jgi:twitching motility two-component system response regulator PilH
MAVNKALVVDDSLTDLANIKSILQSAGWQVTTASNGQQALEKAKADRPSIVFLDIVMPEVDGYMTSRMLSEDAATKGIPVVFVSTKNTKVDQVWARAQGGKALIGKPYTSDQIVDALKFAA